MHATWQALQPMHFDDVDQLGDLAGRARRARCGEGVVVAERRTMSSDCSAMVVS